MIDEDTLDSIQDTAALAGTINGFVKFINLLIHLECYMQYPDVKV